VQAHPQWNIGVEFCLTSEWEHYRWGPLAAKNLVPSLLGPDGAFWHREGELFDRAETRHVEIEYRAQVEYLLDLGLQPSHALCHMDVMRQREDLHELFLSLVEKYRLPARYPDLPCHSPGPSTTAASGWSTTACNPSQSVNT